MSPFSCLVLSFSPLFPFVLLILQGKYLLLSRYALPLNFECSIFQWPSLLRQLLSFVRLFQSWRNWCEPSRFFQRSKAHWLRSTQQRGEIVFSTLIKSQIAGSLENLENLFKVHAKGCGQPGLTFDYLIDHAGLWAAWVYLEREEAFWWHIKRVCITILFVFLVLSLLYSA